MMWNRYNYEEVFYPSLRDYLESLNAWDEDVYFGRADNPNKFIDVFQKATGFGIPDKFNDADVNELWCTYIVPENVEKAIAVMESEDELAAKGKKFFNNFLTILDRTLPKYKTLITNYAAEEAKLMEAIYGRSIVTYGRKDNSTYTPNLNQTTKLNVTPAEQADFSGNGYANQVNVANQNGKSQTDNTSGGKDQTTIESDGGTKMARLKELHDEWDNVFKEWADEFKPLFIYVM